MNFVVFNTFFVIQLVNFALCQQGSSHLESTSPTSPLNIRCDSKYENYENYDMGNINQCNVEGDLDIKSRQSATVNSIIVEPYETKYIWKFEAFWANGTTARYFPRGLEKFFKKIELIHMMNGKLVEINQADLKPLPDLLNLNLDGNEIEIIEKGLFDYNPKIKYVSFDRNKIVEIHPKVFDKLYELIFIHLKENKCIDEGSVIDFQEVNRVVDVVKTQCVGSQDLSDNSTQTVNLRCDFLSKAGDIYACEIHYKLNLRTALPIESVSGRHENIKTNQDVDGFIANKNFIRYIPKGIDKFFPNIKHFHMFGGRLQEIYQSDFKPFPELMELFLSGNEIKVIEKDLFDYNTKIQYINLSGNKITRIHHKVFDHLIDLSTLLLKENPCTNEYSYNDVNGVKKVIENAVQQCKYIEA